MVLSGFFFWWQNTVLHCPAMLYDLLVTLTGSVEAGSTIIKGTARQHHQMPAEAVPARRRPLSALTLIWMALKAVVASRIIFSGQVCNCAERFE